MLFFYSLDTDPLDLFIHLFYWDQDVYEVGHFTVKRSKNTSVLSGGQWWHCFWIDLKPCLALCNFLLLTVWVIHWYEYICNMLISTRVQLYLMSAISSSKQFAGQHPVWFPHCISFFPHPAANLANEGGTAQHRCWDRRWQKMTRKGMINKKITHITKKKYQDKYQAGHLT